MTTSVNQPSKLQANLLTDWLDCLDVAYTPAYTTMRLEALNFKSMFGLSKLLKEYGVDTRGYSIADKSEIALLPTPFVAQLGTDFVVVEAVTPTQITFRHNGKRKSWPAYDFNALWTGIAVVASPAPMASEPDYRLHCIETTGTRIKHWLLVVLSVLLILWFWISDHLYNHWATIALTALDAAGIYVSYLLMLKMLGIHSPHAERVCGVIEKGGCDTVLSQKAAKFFGLFGWSEVGLAYFSVSFAALTVCPAWLPWLAAINVMCLPFSFWSVWYQRRRAHTWCTLCLTVQALLWLKFAVFWTSGTLRSCLPVDWPHLIVLGIFYVVALLVINRLSPHFDRNPAKRYLT